MAANAFIRARIDEKIKAEATAVLAGMGLTISDVLRIVLTKVSHPITAIRMMLQCPPPLALLPGAQCHRTSTSVLKLRKAQLRHNSIKADTRNKACFTARWPTTLRLD